MRPPPRLRSDLRGDAHLAQWWRSTIPPTSLPIPSMSAHNPTITQGYLHQALTQGMEMVISFLASLNVVAPDYLSTTPTLQPTPDGTYIIFHVRKDNSCQLTNFAISLAHPQAYAMLATIDTPIKIRIPPPSRSLDPNTNKSSTSN